MNYLKGSMNARKRWWDIITIPSPAPVKRLEIGNTVSNAVETAVTTIARVKPTMLMPKLDHRFYVPLPVITTGQTRFIAVLIVVASVLVICGLTAFLLYNANYTYDMQSYVQQEIKVIRNGEDILENRVLNLEAQVEALTIDVKAPRLRERKPRHVKATIMNGPQKGQLKEIELP